NDGNGGIDTRTLSWAVADVALWSSVSAWSGAEGDTASLSLAGSVAMTYLPTYSSSDLPQGLSLNPSLGTINSVVGYNNTSAGGTTTIVAHISASATWGLLQTEAITFTIADTNRLPSPSARSKSEG